METKELIVHLSKDIVFSASDIEDSINGLTNQKSGFMALKSVCQKENLMVNGVFDWLRNTKGWLEEWPEVTSKAVADWNSHNINAVVEPKEIMLNNNALLIQIINSSHYVNTNSIHYELFISEMRKAGLEGGYNRDIKDAKPIYTGSQVAGLFNLGYKVVTKRKYSR